jgi:hypothetical protein
VSLHWIRTTIVLTALLGALAALPGTAAGQSCAQTTSLTSLSEFTGRPIRTLHIVTQDPYAFPGPARVLSVLHVRTQARTIERQLLFAPGDTVDTLRVAESLRRLRDQRYLLDIELQARACEGRDSIDLTLTTRDDWSTKAQLNVKSSSSALVGVEERNLFGTGRQASMRLETDDSRLGIVSSLVDPWVLGSPFEARLRFAQFASGNEYSIGLQNRQRSLFDPWGAELAFSRSTRAGVSEPDEMYRRQAVRFLARRRVYASERHVFSVLGGAEAERADLFASASSLLLGPPAMRRSFAAMDVGGVLRSASYDTLTWMLPGGRIVDVPRGIEGEAIVGVGPDFLASSAVLHVDLWTGRSWQPGGRTLILGDLWGSGYVGNERIDAATMRLGVNAFRAAPRGLWQGQLGIERLFNPDPDLRGMATVDPTIAVIPRDSRLAQTGAFAALERSVHLFRLTRSWVLDGALFGAASVRWDAVATPREILDVGMLGAGLRVAPTKTGRGIFRLDLGYPVAGSPMLDRRPRAALSIIPWFGDLRQRDGRRVP